MARRGFTLVELGLTLFILFLLSAVSLTGIFHYRQKSILRFQEERITQDLLLAKTNALAQQRDTDVIFFEDGYAIQSGSDVLQEVKLPKPFTVSSLRLGYNSAGNPRYAGTLYLYRGEKTAAKMTITVGSGLLHWTHL